MFDKTWFKKYQKELLWALNTPIVQNFFRYVLRIYGTRSSLGGRKIVQITPNSITWEIKKGTYQSEFRTHDKFSKRIKYGFYPLWLCFHAWDMLIANRYAPSLNLGFDTTTLYSDTGGDGLISSTNAAYATARDATSGTASAAAATGNCTQNELSGDFFVTRSFFPFDTSSLPDDAIVSSAILSIFEVGTRRTGAGSSVTIVASTQASSTALANEDFDQAGSTSFGAIAITSITDDAYNDFTLNGNGIAAILKTGFTKLAARSSNDIGNVTATGVDDLFQAYFADQAGTTNDPKLTITFGDVLETGYSYIM